MYCLDTNIIVSILRGDKALKQKISSIGSEKLCLTSVTLCELYKGAYKTKDTKNVLAEIDLLIQNYSIFFLDVESSRIFGMDFNTLEKEGKPTQILDLLTACIAKKNGAVVITRNVKHFENIPDLKVEEW